MDSSQNKVWIPAIYFMQGFPFALVNLVSPVLYKSLGFNNTDIAILTSLFLLPWTTKFLISPILENLSTKRNIALWMESLLILFILLLSLSIFYCHSIYCSGAIFIAIACASATHDIVSDGLYIESLTLRGQAKYLGLKSVSYHIGILFCQMSMLYFLGVLLSNHFAYDQAWLYSSFLAILIIFIFVCCNYYFIPMNNYKQLNNFLCFQEKVKNCLLSYKNIWSETKTLPRLFALVFFILIYEFPQTQFMKIMPLFLLDKKSEGGLNFNLKNAALIYGGLSPIGMLMGVSLSGYVINKVGLKKCLLLFAMLAFLGYAGFFLIAFFSIHLFYLVSAITFLTYFLFGLSNGAYLFYLLNTVKNSDSSMSLYAIATTLMMLGTMLAGSASGYLQYLLGYSGFFVWIMIASMGTIFLASYESRKLK